jgi:hypothetical protein
MLHSSRSTRAAEIPAVPLPRSGAHTIRRAATLAALLLLSTGACARHPRPGVTVPALRAALSDTVAARRVHTAGEVARSAVLAERAQSVFSRHDGEARAYVVVSRQGRVERGLVELLPGAEPELGGRLMKALPQWRFRPAERKPGMRVRQLVLVRVRTRERHTTVELEPAPRPEG